MLKWELKRRQLGVLIWIIGVSVMIFMSFIEYKQMEGTDAIYDLIEAFPAIVRVVFGIPNVDFGKFSGYYAMLNYYLAIAFMVYASNAGFKVIKEEEVDLTADFIFTRPISRIRVLLTKYLCFVMAIFVLTFSCGVISYLMALAFGFSNPECVFLYAFGNFIVGLFILSISGLLAALMPKKRMTTILLLLINILLVVIYDSVGGNILLQIITPFRWFDPVRVVKGVIPYGFIILSLVLSAGLSYWSFKVYNKQDITN